MNWLETDDEMQPETREQDELNLTVATRRVWEGLVDGRPECWLLVPRDEADLDEWLISEVTATEVAPLRVCREICEDGSVILSETDPCDDSMSPEEEGW